MVSTTDVPSEMSSIHLGNDNGQQLCGKTAEILCQFSLYPSQVNNLYVDTRPQCLRDCEMGNAGGRAYFRCSFQQRRGAAEDTYCRRPAVRNILEIVSVF